MDPLAGWTVAVTAERRAVEQVELLESRGATVLLTPTVRAERVGDAHLRAVTADLVDRPPDLWVAASGAGVQGWIASAWSWGFGPRLLGALRGAAIVTRGPSTAGALVGEGFDGDWEAGGDTTGEVLDHLRGRGVAGQRVAVLPHGGDMAWFTAALTGLGADVVEVPVYRLGAPAREASVAKLAEAALRRELDAITFTSQTAVANLAA
ncbi:MAG TPA: uroporphyrinogen-III synthase, partial [Acidimicrobiia bacterium]|nr:uroporphyrinogen-III synthase [Acidimicrobiia bacterium]